MATPMMVRVALLLVVAHAHCIFALEKQQVVYVRMADWVDHCVDAQNKTLLTQRRDCDLPRAIDLCKQRTARLTREKPVSNTPKYASVSRRLGARVGNNQNALTLEPSNTFRNLAASIDMPPSPVEEALHLNSTQRDLARAVLANQPDCIIEDSSYSGIAFIDTRASHSVAHRIRLASDLQNVLELVAIGIDTVDYPILDPSLPVAVHGYTIGHTFYMLPSPLLCNSRESEVVCAFPGNTSHTANNEDSDIEHHSFDNMTQANQFAHDYLHDRRLYKELSWSKGVQKVLVIFARPETDPSADMPSDSDIDQSIKLVHDYFVANSGGQFEYDIEKYDSVVTLGHYSQYDGSGKERCCSTNGKCVTPDYNYIHLEASSQVKWAKGEAFLNSWDRVSVVLPPCGKLNWGGLGVVLGANTWINGFGSVNNFARVLAHELGHNLGAAHSEFGDKEYGNRYSVMGYASLPEGHLSMPGKWALGWLSNSQIVTLARTGSNDHRCKVLICVNSVTTWIESHDEGNTFDTGKIYGLQILGVHSHETLWVEYRSKYFSELSRGATLTWAFTALAPSFDVLGTYGPTTLVDAVSSTSTLDDSVLPVGNSWVYDLEQIGAVVKVLEVDSTSKRVRVSIEFVKTEHEYDYHDNSRLTTPPGGNIEDVKCAQTSTFEVSDSSALDIKHILLEQPTVLSMESSVAACLGSSTSLPDDAGLYIYHQYPLQLELGDMAKPGIGAAFFVKMTCTSNGLDFSQDIEDFATSEKDDYMRFSPSNYLVLWTGAGTAALTVSVAVDCETKYCTIGYYMDPTTFNCKTCPAGFTSWRGSEGISSCYRSCDVVTVQNAQSSSSEGVYQKVGHMNGAPLFEMTNGAIPYLLYLNLWRNYWYVSEEDNWSWVLDYLSIGSGNIVKHPNMFVTVGGNPVGIGGEYNFECACATAEQYVDENESTGCGTCPYGEIANADDHGSSSCFVPCKRFQITNANSYYKGEYVLIDGYPLAPLFRRTTTPHLEIWRWAKKWYIGVSRASQSVYVRSLDEYASWPTYVQNWSTELAFMCLDTGLPFTSSPVMSTPRPSYRPTTTSENNNRSSIPTKAPTSFQQKNGAEQTNIPTRAPITRAPASCAESDVLGICVALNNDATGCVQSGKCSYCYDTKLCVPGHDTTSLCPVSESYYTQCTPPPTMPACPATSDKCQTIERNQCGTDRWNRFHCGFCFGSCNSVDACRTPDLFSHCLVTKSLPPTPMLSTLPPATRSPTTEVDCPPQVVLNECLVIASDRARCTRGFWARKCTWCDDTCQPGKDSQVCSEPEMYDGCEN